MADDQEYEYILAEVSAVHAVAKAQQRCVYAYLWVVHVGCVAHGMVPQ